ncbi:MBL fold metallo-hydrolase [Chryseobacterium sp. BIGb0232]|uniref:MBL fold metallo-hydrolase n=1 Tax=Chryseobacterium sp. BIGb0232 TaxID=2940598 RepID=UPI000F4716B9|nr:MBL fold metallo-hydrolase [Chryseobacterium sp. BIGb0232]MCS4300595.1 L-ascorbate metabolism protein UlaG (beta-lactamase superfamily) [Chryseobacterium sp. BIGb0232]ROS20519.1 L-ascorbate metabolism protein UlaG (beta-lactamase superfamily) [Chryseobacterium nakagawai]
MKKILTIIKTVGAVLLCLILIVTVTVYFYMKQPQFGALPEGERLASIKESVHYKNGKFRNLEEKPVITPGYSFIEEIWKSMVETYPNTEPEGVLPSVKTNLKAIPSHENILVWFGHSSFFLQVDGIKILVDPVFSGKASPLPWGVKAYKGSDVYTVADMPEIDYMLLSHDHYDHLDYETVKALQSKVKFVVCGLGAGAHYEKWGYKPKQIIEKDWGDKLEVKQGFAIYTENTHHAGGRGFKDSQALWLSFFIQSSAMNIYYSGDGGYSDRFKKIAADHPAIDWAIMECGQYNKAWRSVHELPEEVALATAELKAKNLLPVHHSKFTLAKHPWNEPLNRIYALSQSKNYRLATPIIGEVVRLDDGAQTFKQWWKNVK